MLTQGVFCNTEQLWYLGAWREHHRGELCTDSLNNMRKASNIRATERTNFGMACFRNLGRDGSWNLFTVSTGEARPPGIHHLFCSVGYAVPCILWVLLIMKRVAETFLLSHCSIFSRVRPLLDAGKNPPNLHVLGQIYEIIFRNIQPVFQNRCCKIAKKDF